MESIGISIARALGKVQSKIERSAQVRLKEGMTELLPYIMDNMHDSFPPRARTSIKTKKIYAAKNTTKKLYARSGALKRSLVYNNKSGGNISKIIRANANEVVADFGIDLDIVPYARVHEYGSGRMPARPYFFPGIRAYLLDNEKILVKDIIESAFADFA